MVGLTAKMFGRLVPPDFSFYTVSFLLNPSSPHSCFFLPKPACREGTRRQEITVMPCSFRLDLAKLLQLTPAQGQAGDRLPPTPQGWN